jgi:hypothetical protein
VGGVASPHEHGSRSPSSRMAGDAGYRSPGYGMPRAVRGLACFMRLCLDGGQSDSAYLGGSSDHTARVWEPRGHVEVLRDSLRAIEYGGVQSGWPVSNQ